MARRKKKRGFFRIIFGSIGIVIKYSMQILNIFVDRFFRYLNKALVWTFTKLFHVSKKGVQKVKAKKKSKEEFVEVKVKEDVKQPEHEAVYEQFKVLETKEGEFEKFEKRLYDSKSLIGIILGARGTGKSAIGIKILENLYTKTGRKVAALGFKKKDMPTWVKVIEELSEVENGSFILVDEGGIVFSSRSSMSAPNKLLSELLLIARHKDLSVLFITQNSANLEVNTIRQADYMILKPSSLLQKDFERKKIKEIYEGATEDFKKLKGDPGLTYIYSHNYRGFISNPLPSFWSEKISKAFDMYKKD